MSRTSHRQRIHDTLRARILSGEIGPGDRLVDIVIAGEMGVSRMPVREALMQLASEGYLEGTSRGFSLPSLSHQRILDIYALRRLIEPHAAASAAQSRSESALEQMTAAVEASAATLETAEFEPFLRASELFRSLWLAEVPNPELRAVIERQSGQVQTVRLLTMRSPDAHRTVIAGQRDLLQAIQRRDALDAADCTLRYLHAGEASYRAQHQASKASRPD